MGERLLQVFVKAKQTPGAHCATQKHLGNQNMAEQI